MKNIPPISSTLLKFTLLLFCFLALMTSSFGVIYRLDEDIMPDADGVYNVPEGAEFLIQFEGGFSMKKNDLFSAKIKAYNKCSIEGSSIICEAFTSDNICEITNNKSLYHKGLHYVAIFKAVRIDIDEKPIISFYKDMGPIFGKGEPLSIKIRVVENAAVPSTSDSIDATAPQIIPISEKYIQNSPPLQMGEYENVASNGKLAQRAVVEALEKHSLN